MKTTAAVPSTIEDYIAGFPQKIQKILETIRRTIKEEAPGSEETISYRIPTFMLNGPLIYVAAYKTHIGLYPITAALRAKFKKELSGHLSGKGTARFSYDRPIPYALIGKLVKFRVKENLEQVRTQARTRKS